MYVTHSIVFIISLVVDVPPAAGVDWMAFLIVLYMERIQK